jgi:hypothetical protein
MRLHWKNALFVSLAATLAAGLSGCATIVVGKTQVLTIDSNIRDAEVVVNGKVIGVTPYTGPVERGSTTTVTLRKPGYSNKTMTLNTEVEPVFFGNIICGGFFGSTTDNATGAMYKYAPATINLDLVAAEGK